ncbi:MAG: YitT family protein [Hornefia sp.]|nr:YitT family protein [Hornefia sp.]
MNFRKTRDPRVPLTKSERIRREMLRIFSVTLGAAICAFNINSFVSAGALFPGGFAGITLLVTRLSSKYLELFVPYSLIFLPLNAISVYFGYKGLGKKFTFYTVYYVVLSSLLTDILPNVQITNDVLLAAVFGGITSGFSGLLCLWVGTSSGGTDLLSVYFSEKRGISTWNYILTGNIIILVLAGFFFGWDKALYSIIYQYVLVQLYHELFKRYHKHTLIVITDMPESVYDKISIMTHHDATLFKGEGFFLEQRKNMIYSVVESNQVDMIIKEIKDVDPKAFINVMKTERLSGRFYKRPRD